MEQLNPIIKQVVDAVEDEVKDDTVYLDDFMTYLESNGIDTSLIHIADKEKR